MSSIENTIIARLEKEGNKFEILVDPKLAYDYKTGSRKEIENVLIVEEVFKDAKKGDRASSVTLKKFLGTDDVLEVAKRIFAEGDLQITTDQRRKAVEDKHARIVALIARNCWNPQTKTPHPPMRIENAMQQVRFHVDPFKSAEEQVPRVIEKIREIIPISTDQIKIAVKLEPQFVGRGYGLLKEYGLSKEEYAGDGSLMAVCEIPAGIQGEFYDKLNKLTGGTVQTKLL